MDLAATSTLLSTAITSINTIAKASKAYSEADLRLKLAEIMNNLSEAKVEVIEARQKIRELEIKLNEKDQLSEFKAKLYLEGNVYLHLDGEAQGFGIGPWCTHCLEVNEKPITLHYIEKTPPQSHPYSHPGEHEYQCPACERATVAPDDINEYHQKRSRHFKRS